MYWEVLELIEIYDSRFPACLPVAPIDMEATLLLLLLSLLLILFLLLLLLLFLSYFLYNWCKDSNVNTNPSTMSLWKELIIRHKYYF